jgi:methionyl-tRNA synthetase
MLHHMSSTEYLNYEGGKFSKSRGVGVFGTDVMETGIPADVWRFYIFYNRPERADALFTWKDFQEKVNGELIGNLGNLINRTLSFVTRYYDGEIPAPPASADPSSGGGPALNPSFLETVRNYEEGIAARLERAELRDAFRMVFELSSFANKAFQDAEPWRLRREDPPRAASVIRDLVRVVRDMAVLAEPCMPATAERIASFFGLTLGKDFSWKGLDGDAGLSGKIKSEVLFAKLEDGHINELRERYSGSQKERAEEKGGSALSASPSPAAGAPVPKDAPPPETGRAPARSPEEIAAAFSSTLDLRVAKITGIERHPKADKLYVETLEIAGAGGSVEERIIVSGLVPFYREEELLGRHIIVAYNLRAAKLRGVESRGMLLAASDRGGPEGGERCEVLDAGDAPTGSRVVLVGLPPDSPPPG